MKYRTAFKALALTYVVVIGLILAINAKADQMEDYNRRQEVQRRQLIQDMTWWNSQQLLDEQRQMREDMERERRKRTAEERQRQLYDSVEDLR